MENKKYLETEDLMDSVVNVARKYSRNCAMEQDDMEQDLWEFILPKKFKVEDLAMARKCLVNRAIDLSRKSWRESNGIVNVDFNGVDQDDTRNSYGDMLSYESDVNEDSHIESGYERVESEEKIRKALSCLGDRERKYVVSKAYLCCNLEFLKDDFFKMIEGISDESREILMSSAKGDSDDAILKIVCGIKTGTNSGSIRSMKTILRKQFMSMLIG